MKIYVCYWGIEDNINYTQLQHDSLIVFTKEQDKDRWFDGQSRRRKQDLESGMSYSDEPIVKEFEIE